MTVVFEIVESPFGDLACVLVLMTERTRIAVPCSEAASEICSGFEPLRMYIVCDVLHSVREDRIARDDLAICVAFLFEPAVVEIHINVTRIAQPEIAECVGGIEKKLLGGIAVNGAV